MTDPIDDMRVPRCPDCASTLRDAGPGYWCPGCRLVFMPAVDDPASKPLTSSPRAQPATFSLDDTTRYIRRE